MTAENWAGGFSRQTVQVKHVVLLLVLFAASLALNVTLAVKLRQLRVLSVPSSVRPGVLVRHLGALDSQGREVEVTFVTDRPTVIYVTSPGCKWCRRNLNNIQTLVDARSKEYRFIVLSIAGSQSLTSHETDPARSQILYRPSPEFISQMHLGSTPQKLW
jgi:hypothetical protein